MRVVSFNSDMDPEKDAVLSRKCHSRRNVEEWVVESFMCEDYSGRGNDWNGVV